LQSFDLFQTPLNTKYIIIDNETIYLIHSVQMQEVCCELTCKSKS